MKNNIEIIP